MARRPRQDEERSMDSLMDAMTNVVGILLLILIVSSLGSGITQVVQEIMENMPEISEEQLEAMKESHEKTLANLEDIRTTQTDIQKNMIAPDEAVQLAANLKNFELENADLAEKTSDIAEWKRKIDELKPTEDEKRVRNETAQVELKKLEDILAAKDPVEQPPARVITLPNPRKPSVDEMVYYVACKHQKLYIIGEPYKMINDIRNVLDSKFADLAYTGGEFGSYTHALYTDKKKENDQPLAHMIEYRAKTKRDKENLAYMNAVKQSLADKSEERSMYQLLFGMNEEQQEQKKEWSVNKLRLDGKKVVSFFKSLEGLRSIDYVPVIVGDRIRIEVALNPEKGLTEEQFMSPTSPYVAMVKEALNKRRTFVMFHVAPDSFDTYLKARAFADNQRLNAGWNLWDGTRLGQNELEPHRKFETLPYDLTALPESEYLKISKAVGPKVVAQYNAYLKDFVADDPELKIPEKPAARSDRTVEDYKKALIAERESWMRSVQYYSYSLYQSPWAASEATKREDVLIQHHPPYVMFTRVFTPTRPPVTARPLRKPPTEKPRPTSGLTLD